MSFSSFDVLCHGMELILVTSNQKVSLTNPEYIVCTPTPTPPPLSAMGGGRGGGVNLQFSKREGLNKISTFRGGLLGKRGGDIFQGRVAIVT